MKLSTLHEARNPEFEKELEPLITAPFKTYTQRRKEKEQEFHSDDTFHSDDEFGHISKAVKNVTSTGGALIKAYRYWQKNFNGERWPALEQAFLNRTWTFKGGSSMENSARTSIFDYINNLKESWPEGEKIAVGLLSSHGALMYHDKPSVMKYIISRPKIQGLVDRIEEKHKALAQWREKWQTQEIPKYEQDYKNWEQEVKEWERNQIEKQASIGTNFHDEDEFGHNVKPFPPHRPPEPRLYHSRQDFTDAYVKPDWKPAPKKSEAQEFDEKLKEIEKRPPFAGWA